MSTASKAAVSAAVPWLIGAAAIWLGVKYVLPKLGTLIPSLAGSVGAAAGSVAVGVAQAPYAAVNGAGSAITDDPDWTLGGWIYDLTHDPYDPNSLASIGGASLNAPDRQTVSRRYADTANATAGTDWLGFFGEW